MLTTIILIGNIVPYNFNIKWFYTIIFCIGKIKIFIPNTNNIFSERE